MSELFKKNNADLNISDITIGIDKTKMANYKENLKTILLIQTQDLLRNVGEIQATIDSGWQGISRDQFYKSFESAIEKVCNDLEAEYDDLEFRLTELEHNYLNQDAAMMLK